MLAQSMMRSRLGGHSTAALAQQSGRVMQRTAFWKSVHRLKAGVTVPSCSCDLLG